LTDSPGFHLRAAKGLKHLGIPIVHLIAPQAWAWREYRVKTLRSTLARLLCIFPFEERFFADRGVPATFIGHPLARLVTAKLTPSEFRSRFGLPEDARILALVPGSRPGELARHMPIVLDAVRRIRERHSLIPILALPEGFRPANQTFWEPIRAASIQCIEGHTWEVLAQADLALAKSGTVNIEAALLGTPMVTFYRVNALTFIVGRRFVKTPFFSIVNLIAGRKVVPELIQDEMTAERIAAEGCALLDSPQAAVAMKSGLSEVAGKLRSERDPMEIAADWVERIWRENSVTTA